MRSLLQTIPLNLTRLLTATACLFIATVSKAQPPADVKIDISKMNSRQSMSGPYSFYVPPHSDYYFHHIDELGFKLDWVRHAGPVYPLKKPMGTPLFTTTYTYGGKTYTLEDYYKRSCVLGLLILKDNQIISESYFHGSDQNSQFLSNSVQKSMTSTLFGIALEEGKIGSVNDPVTKYLPGLSECAYNRCTLKDVLEMATGIEASEDFFDPKASIHQFNEMNLSGIPSYYDYIKSIKANPNVVPGTVFEYQSINTEVLGLVIEKTTGVPLNEYMQEKLWQKIGAQSDGFIWRAQKQADQCAFGCFCATLRDYARFGLMIMHGGTLAGNRVVGAEWISEATKPQPFGSTKPHDNTKEGYGYQWWIPAGNDGAFEARGIFGQLIYINPKKGILIAQNSAWPKPDETEFWDEMSAFINAVVAELSK